MKCDKLKKRQRTTCKQYEYASYLKRWNPVIYNIYILFNSQIKQLIRDEEQFHIAISENNYLYAESIAATFRIMTGSSPVCTEMEMIIELEKMK